MTPELVQLVAVLDDQRSGVLSKVAGLSETDVRRGTVDSGTNPAGLLQHLTFAESKWFEQIVVGGKSTRGSRTMTVDPTVSLRTPRPEFRKACEASNAIIARWLSMGLSMNSTRTSRTRADGVDCQVRSAW